MVIAGIPREEIRHTRAVQDWLTEGRQEGRQEGEARGEARGEAKVPSANSPAAADPSAKPPPPRSRRRRWSSWNH